MTRTEIADRICERLAQEKATLTTQFRTPGRVPAFVLDDLLPADMARAGFQAYPRPSQMLKRHSLRESKYVAVQLDRYAPLLEEVVYAFQDPRVMALFTEISGIDELLPDPRLYAGGCSAMVKDSFLNPHLDNSHDGKQEHYRELNSL